MPHGYVWICTIVFRTEKFSPFGRLSLQCINTSHRCCLFHSRLSFHNNPGSVKYMISLKWPDQPTQHPVQRVLSASSPRRTSIQPPLLVTGLPKRMSTNGISRGRVKAPLLSGPDLCEHCLRRCSRCKRVSSQCMKGQTT
jgi:hypothetical protein